MAASALHRPVEGQSGAAPRREADGRSADQNPIAVRPIPAADVRSAAEGICFLSLRVHDRHLLARSVPEASARISCRQALSLSWFDCLRGLSKFDGRLVEEVRHEAEVADVRYLTARGGQLNHVSGNDVAHVSEEREDGAALEPPGDHVPAQEGSVVRVVATNFGPARTLHVADEIEPALFRKKRANPVPVPRPEELHIPEDDGRDSGLARGRAPVSACEGGPVRDEGTLARQQQ